MISIECSPGRARSFQRITRFLPPEGIEDPRSIFAFKIRLAALMFGNAQLLLSPTDVALANILPFLGYLARMKAGLRGSAAAPGRRNSDYP